jgi:hypothetical protein
MTTPLLLEPPQFLDPFEAFGNSSEVFSDLPQVGFNGRGAKDAANKIMA